MLHRAVGAGARLPGLLALVHRERLESSRRSRHGRDKPRAIAPRRAHAWEEARALVPLQSEQYQQIGERHRALDRRCGSGPTEHRRITRTRSWWSARAAGAAVTVGLLLVGKLKFLLLGLTKLSTFASMFGFIAVYWSIHGWPLAVGLAGSIYIHEMGHVAMLRRLGDPGRRAALHSWRRRARDAEGAHHRSGCRRAHRSGRTGVGAGRGGRRVAHLSRNGAPIWLAITELTGFLNLFNLIPIWQLDGSRGFHALSRQERWIVVGAIGAALWLTGVGVLWIVGAVAIFRTSAVPARPPRRAGPGPPADAPHLRGPGARARVVRPQHVMTRT